MRTVGNYTSARHKFERALKLDSKNSAAKFELEILEEIVALDKAIDDDSVPEIMRIRAMQECTPEPQYRRTGICSLAF